MMSVKLSIRCRSCSEMSYSDAIGRCPSCGAAKADQEIVCEIPLTLMTAVEAQDFKTVVIEAKDSELKVLYQAHGARGLSPFWDQRLDLIEAELKRRQGRR
jgi:hypothetical protein